PGRADVGSGIRPFGLPSPYRHRPERPLNSRRTRRSDSSGRDLCPLPPARRLRKSLAFRPVRPRLSLGLAAAAPPPLTRGRGGRMGIRRFWRAAGGLVGGEARAQLSE